MRVAVWFVPTILSLSPLPIQGAGSAPWSQVLGTYLDWLSKECHPNTFGQIPDDPDLIQTLVTVWSSEAGILCITA